MLMWPGCSPMPAHRYEPSPVPQHENLVVRLSLTAGQKKPRPVLLLPPASENTGPLKISSLATIQISQLVSHVVAGRSGPSESVETAASDLTEATRQTLSDKRNVTTSHAPQEHAQVRIAAQ